MAKKPAKAESVREEAPVETTPEVSVEETITPAEVPVQESAALPEESFVANPSETEAPVEVAEASVAAALEAATIESTNTPAPSFEEQTAVSAAVETPVEAVVEPAPEEETIAVSKKALYKMMVALSRGQVQYYTSFQIIPRIGDLFGLESVPERQAKWEEIKGWVEGAKL